MINDAIRKSITQIKNILVSVSEMYSEKYLRFGSEGRKLKVCMLFSQLCEEILQLKSGLQNLATQFKKKSSLQKESKSIIKYECKSNNLVTLREETLFALHTLVGKIDSMHQLLVKARTLFSTKDGQTGEVYQNVQIPQLSKQLRRGRQTIAQLNQQLTTAPKGISFSD